MGFWSDLLFGSDEYHQRKHEEFLMKLNLQEDEIICDACEGEGWVIAHCGDMKCGKCNGKGKLKTPSNQN